MLKITPVTTHSPKSAHYASVSANGRLYLHGGVSSYGASNPESDLWWFDPNTAHWVVLNKEGPALSHHAAFVSEDRFLNFVGGWDGRIRSAEIAVFDTRHEKWMPNPVVSGFPVGGGLSSHTVTPLEEGALVIGRLGGLRTQRKTSAVLELSGNHETGFNFQVKELPVLSRSGHTATIRRDGQSVIIGGRFEPHREMDCESLPHRNFKLDLKSCLADLGPAVEKIAAPTGKFMVASRRYHVAVGDSAGRILIHGGEDYRHSPPRDGQPKSDFGVLCPKEKDGPWRTVASQYDSIKEVALSGHTALSNNGTVFMFGGFTTGWKANDTTYEIKIKS